MTTCNSERQFCRRTVLSLLALLPVRRAFARESGLRLFVDRKVIDVACMRGYLLTQLTGERQPSVACYVLELPPAGNALYVSAIPAGTYPVRVRADGNRGWRLELSRVPGRSNVQIHVGNYPKDTVGCLLPGIGALPNTCSVGGSQAAMKQLRTLFTVFGDDGKTELTIRDV
jgi:hypothetical protein